MEKVYTKSIRNVALLGHGGSGKTSLAESMLYISRLTDRLGTIADGNTVCDYDPEEIKEAVLFPQPALLCFGTVLK
jgi:elongation factor G